MADVKVVAHQQHRPGRQLEYVLAGAVAEDRLKATHASGAHHDQVAVEFVGHFQHRLLGVSLANDCVHLAGVEPKPLHRFGGDRCRFLGVLREALTSLLRHHVQQVDAGCAHRRDVAQHAHHLFHVAFAGIGD